MRLGSFYLGLGLSALFVLAAALSFIWTPYDHEALDIANKLKPPNGAHWLGTDHFGRDIATLIMVGARTSIAERAKQPRSRCDCLFLRRCIAGDTRWHFVVFRLGSMAVSGRWSFCLWDGLYVIAAQRR